ncbi:MAG: DUF4349 domain-containing protein [Spirochaetales bacterium]|nr:MAG: DUF4349 domain-containing protein [Spirochaetales bacterium]
MPLFIMWVGSVGAWGQAGSLAATAEVQVLCVDREVSSAAFADWAERAGGYYTLRSLEAVILRIPPDRLAELREMIESGGDTIVYYRPGTVDVQQELSQVEAAITSRTEALERVLAYMDDSDVVATLAFERELRSLNGEIEAFTGRRRSLLSSVTYAYVTIALSSRQSSIPSQLPSSFEWINTIDLYRFIDRTRSLGAMR